MKPPYSITEFDIQAFFDGELSEQEEIRVQEYIARNRTALDYYLKLLKQQSLLHKWAGRVHKKLH